MTEDSADSGTGTLREEKEYTMNETTARVIVEVEDDGALSDDDRVELAVALLEQGLNTEFANWDHNHPVPTVNNRVI